MGGLFGGGPSPQAAAPVPPAAIPATMANATASQAGINQRQQAAAAAGAGMNGTLQNSGGAQGLQPASTAGKSLLG